MQAPAIEIVRASKSFVKGERVLKDVSLSIGRGEMVALIGASGSGKSTLIRSVAGLTTIDKASGSNHGVIRAFGEAMQANGRVTSAAKALRSRIAIVFQQFNLVPRLPVLTNVCVGVLGRIPRWRGTLGRFTHAEKQLAMQALTRVGIAEQALKRGSQLSGGQQQRAAIARSLVQGAEILIADEPIASLDPSSARRVMDILSDLNRRDGITVLVSLHQVGRRGASRRGRIITAPVTTGPKPRPPPPEPSCLNRLFDRRARHRPPHHLIGLRTVGTRVEPEIQVEGYTCFANFWR